MKPLDRSEKLAKALKGWMSKYSPFPAVQRDALTFQLKPVSATKTGFRVTASQVRRQSISSDRRHAKALEASLPTLAPIHSTAHPQQASGGRTLSTAKAIGLWDLWSRRVNPEMVRCAGYCPPSHVCQPRDCLGEGRLLCPAMHLSDCVQEHKHGARRGNHHSGAGHPAARARGAAARARGAAAPSRGHRQSQVSTADRLLGREPGWGWIMAER